MPYDGSGNFNRSFPPGGWQGDAAASIKIKADRHDQHDADLASGLSNALCKDGQSQVTANIPWNGFRITNLGAPVDPNDAVTKAFADTLRNFSTGIALPGADLNGRLSFTAPTGVNGISWTAGDLFFGTRAAVANQTPDRFIFNSESDASGSDVLTVSDFGHVQAPSQFTTSTNAFWDASVSKWRLPVAGRASVAQMGNGEVRMYSNADLSTDPYATPAMTNFFTAIFNGNASMILNKSASGKVNDFYGQMDGKSRWLIRMGNEVAETTTDKEGSNFVIHSYDNAGTVSAPAMHILRSDSSAHFYGALSTAGSFSAGGAIASSGVFASTIGSTVLGTVSGSAGSVYLRPNGWDSTVGEAIVGSTGSLYIGGVTSGGVNTKLIHPWTMTSSVSQTSGSSHHTFNNPNGQVGAINTTNSTTSYVTSSDERLKDFTGAFDPDAAAAIIKADPVRRFTWKDGGIAAVGWGAQTSHAVDPDLAEAPIAEDGNWGIDYGRRTPYLWAALSGALDKIAELEARLAALEGATA